MKVKLIVPKWNPDAIWGQFVFRFPYLSLTTLAALLPPDIEVSVVDENVDEIDFNEDVDLVGISIITPHAPRGYEIARTYREKGVKVVMGGFHASCLPEEALEHCDAVSVGEGEQTWPRIIDDYRNGGLNQVYRADGYHSLENIPVARRDLLKPKGYFFTNTVQTTRGCPFDCDFCTVTAFYGRTYRCRPIEDIEAELDSMMGGAGFVFFVDDNIIGRPSYARELFSMLKGRRIKWLSHASTNLAEDPELLKLAGESGCYGLFVGFETLTQEGIKALNKKQNKIEKYGEVIRSMHDNGIGVLGSFIFGYDWDTRDSFDIVQEFADRNRLDGALYTILTPYPGTRVFERMKSEGRILSTQWEKYDMAHVVFRPKNMSPDELQEGYLRANRDFYSFGSMFRRLPALRRSLQIFGPMNWGFRRAWNGFTYQ